MSANYTCNQFDKAYKPTRLGNWEVPKWHLNRPKGRSTVTKVIANDRGHLLPGVQKADQKHWAGLYLGTYQLPKRISKDTAIELASPKCQTWMKRSYHHPFIDRGQRHKNGKDDKLEDIYAKERPDETNRDADRDSIKSVKSAVTNAPADVSSSIVRNCASADGALNSTGTGGRGSDGGAGLAVVGGGCGRPGARTPSSPALSRISVSGDDHHREHHHQQEGGGGGGDEEPREEETGGGRRYGDAHRHHGLPDAIEDAVYRSLQTKRHKHPGLGLDGCWPKCSAVAYKSFNDPGPTQCSKLRVYRPRTSSSPAARDNEKHDGKTAERRHRARDASPRPKTCVPRVTAQQLSDIRLALCWDLDAPLDRNRRPDEPAVFHKVRQQLDEQHKDGQRSPRGSADSGGAGPRQRPQNSSAVMGFVRAPPPAENVGGGGGGDDDDARLAGKFVPESRRMQTRECLLKNRNLSAVLELIPDKETNAAAAADEQRLSSSSASSRRGAKNGSDGSTKNGSDGSAKNGSDGSAKNGSDGSAKNGSVGNARDDDNGRSSAECSSGGRRRSHHRRHHRRRAARRDEEEKEQRPPRHAYRPCAACDDPEAVAAACARHPKDDDYKMAFKAGVPVSTPVKHRAAAAGQPARHRLKVPKPRTTNSDKKKYVIGTLLPPFSMWPGTTARDYPEHWRLTSVYRQAFKPLELRKQPLLQTIYL